MKTHYDVLNLDKKCSAKEIKDSFIKLSKKFHPDLNKSSDAHQKFIEVNEAYSVLGNTSSRYKYDATLSEPRQVHRTVYRHDINRHDMRDPYMHYPYTYARYRNYDRGGPYITTTKLKMVVLCCLVMVFGSGLQIAAESHRRAFRSQEIARSLREARERSRRFHNARKLREHREQSETLSKDD